MEGVKKKTLTDRSVGSTLSKRTCRPHILSSQCFLLLTPPPKQHPNQRRRGCYPESGDGRRPTGDTINRSNVDLQAYPLATLSLSLYIYIYVCVCVCVCVSNSRLALSGDLPEELIIEILCKLPVESIVKCTVVCKKWYCIIKSQAFISIHLNNKRKDDHNQDCVLVHWQTSLAEKRYTLHWDHHDFNEDFYDYIPLPLLPNTALCYDSSSSNTLLASCNGLLLMRHDHRECTFFFLWNPCIRKLQFLPKPISLLVEKSEGLHEQSFGLGFDSATNDYKILRISQLWKKGTVEVNSVGFQLYSLKAGYWKHITSISFEHEIVMDYYHSPLAFLNGFLHYLAFQRVENSNPYAYCNFVVAFDVGQETFCKIMLPKTFEVSYLSELSVWAYKDSSIAVFQHNYSSSEFSLWVMGEYGVADSWANLLTVSDRLDLVHEVFDVASFTKNGELVLKVDEPGELDFRVKIFLYDPETRQFREVPSWLDYYCVGSYSYAKTLVLLDMVNDANVEIRCN